MFYRLMFSLAVCISLASAPAFAVSTNEQNCLKTSCNEHDYADEIFSVDSDFSMNLSRCDDFITIECCATGATGGCGNECRYTKTCCTWGPTVQCWTNY